MENEARPSKPDTRSAELPEDFGESDASPETTESEEAPEREDRDAIPPDGRAEEASESKLERCEKTIDEHLSNEIEFSRAAREIINDHLYTGKGFESLDAYTNATFDVVQITFRKWTYYANVYDIIEENREEIAKRNLTNVRDVPLPRIKGWTRPLHSKANEGLVDQVIETWAALVRRYGSSITGKKVKEVRKELFDEDKDSEEDPENGGDPEGDHSGEDEQDTGAGESSSQNEEGSSDEDTEGERTDGPGDDNPSDEDSGDDDSGDNEPGLGSSGGDSDGDEGDRGKGDRGKGDEPGGFSVDLPSGIETRDRGSACGGGVARAEPTKGDVEELARKAEQGEEGFYDSSTDDRVASKVWTVLAPSSGFGAGLPEEGPADEDPVGVVLKPERLGQITGLVQGHDGERVLVCPGIDLFSEVVPDGVIEAILGRCRKTDHQPVVFTRHLDRASDFDLSDLWFGTSAERPTLEETEQALSNAAPGAAVRWLLYDVEKKDKEDPPSFSGESEWIVYDPPGGAGVSLTVAETQSLITAAEEAGADWSFRSAFKTCGDSDPSEEGTEVCSVEHSDEDSGPEGGPSGESGAV